MRESSAPVTESDRTSPAAGAHLHAVRPDGDHVRLGAMRRGAKGVIAGIAIRHGGGHAIDPEELERRLLEMGFVEGAHVEILHEGPIGRDPIAVKLDDSRVALRRRDADALIVATGKDAHTK